jgi:fengycin family lipopeptide synthetase D
VVSPRPISTSYLRDYLSRELPDYIVPSNFIQLEKIPITLSGKIDRDSLPQQGFTNSKEYIAPKDRVEKTLAVIWSEILSVKKEEISRDANFFDLGGHSLRATILINQIHQQLEVKVPLAEIFKSTTIQALAQYIRDSETETFQPLQPMEKKGYYRLSSGQKRFYVLQQMDPDSIAYNIWGIVPLEKEWDIQQSKKTFRQLIRRYDSLRTSIQVVEDQPVQKIHDSMERVVENMDIKLKQLELVDQEDKIGLTYELKKDRQGIAVDT